MELLKIAYLQMRSDRAQKLCLMSFKLHGGFKKASSKREGFV